jgi:hypothetical protein
MNTPTPVTLASEAKKATAWLGSNWYAWGIGAGSGAVIVKVAHLFGLLKFI